MGIPPEIIPWLASPLILWAGWRELQDTIAAGKAKRALEAAVLFKAETDPQARDAIVLAANNARRADGASAVVRDSVLALDSVDAKVVRTTLDEGERRGSFDYVQDIARRVSIKLLPTA